MTKTKQEIERDYDYEYDYDTSYIDHEWEEADKYCDNDFHDVLEDD